MDYEALVAQLFERHRSVQTAGFSGDAYKPGLEAMESYAAFLGHPETAFRSIHVAGTNGKGSVCSMLAAALAASGLRVGLYTSPHLLDFRERIKIICPAGGNGAGEAAWARTPWSPVTLEREGPADCDRTVGACSESDWRQAVGGKKRAQRAEGVRPQLPGGAVAPAEDLYAYCLVSKEAVCEFLSEYDRAGLTFFEVTTGIAFWWFARQKVDVAVIETGLGGRLDSTNIITPELSVITSIGLDHCDLLGSTRAEIAAEKAGIFKPGVPALVWGRDPETQPVFERIAEHVGSRLFYAEDFEVPAVPVLDLSGPCQDLNFRTVFAALDILFDLSPRDGQVSENQPVFCKPLNVNCLRSVMLDAIAAAGRITGFRGRWEVLRTDPLVICDIGHNPPAIAANFARLRLLRKPILIVYGAMKDKDVDTISSLLPPYAQYFLVQPATPRAMPAGDLALKLKNLHCTVSGTVADGIRDAMAQACSGTIVYIGGSTYVVSEALQFFEGL